MLNASGIGTFIKNILPHLSGKLQLSLLCLAEDEEGLHSLCEGKLIFMKSKIYSISEQFELPRKIPRCDLFWSPHYNLPLFPIRAKKRLVTIHDVAPLVFFSKLSFIQKVYAKLFFNTALLISDEVTSVSKFSVDELSRYCFVRKKKQPIPIPNSIAPRFFQKVSLEQKVEVQKKYQLPEKFLLFVGNVKPHKNLKRLLQVMERLPDEHLVILGASEKMHTVDHEVIERAQLQSNVQFAGFVEDEELPSLYCLAKAAILPSLYEGFGFVPLEALACGCPTVASNAASIPEVCEDAVEYIDPTSLDSIQTGIQKLLEDQERCNQLLKNGEKLLKRYTPQNCAKQYLSLIHGIV
ncbi:MAG: glycosyltransferase family 4 protein [Chlamydiae bacterium]|nr:glycosyltransferase family 4 protein [Chlamydiota bacterium]